MTEFSPPRIGLPRTALGPHAAAHWAARHPEHVALQHVEGEALSYAETDALGRRWALALGECGVEAGSHVATLLHNGFAAQALWLGLGWLRAVEVPINTAQKGPLLHHALSASDSRFLVTSREFLKTLGDLDAALPVLEHILLVDGEGGDSPTDATCIDMRPALERATAEGDLEGPDYRDIAAI
ncbi:MAG: AMP-binding protein, partial [Myxococcota bacterium]